jgi:hypothetical protein
VYKKEIGFGLRNLGGLYGYLTGMAVEAVAILALMGVGLLISILGFYLWK